MLFEEFLIPIASWLDTSTQNVGIMLSLVISIALMLIVAIAAKGEKFILPSLILFIACTVLFTAFGWFPIWTGTILALGVALGAAYYMSKMGGSGGG